MCHTPEQTWQWTKQTESSPSWGWLVDRWARSKVNDTYGLHRVIRAPEKDEAGAGVGP